MTFNPAVTAGNEDEPKLGNTPAAPRVLGARQLFTRKNPGAPGKLGKSSTKAESLSKLRGKGALA